MPFEGVVCVLKPPGLTSSDVVVDVRRIFHEKRVGHTGTLDPAAAGVLPVCIGRATRLFDYLVDKRKRYLAEIRFGAATDTEDAYGAVIERAECDVSAEALEAVLPSFLGDQLQTPPIYSSLNVNGVKMYKLARRGEVTAPVEERKRLITVSRMELVEKLDKNSFLIDIECSKGTYVRTLCRDIGRKLGVPAYMPFLLRTASGSFDLSCSHTIAELKELSEQAALESVLVLMDEAVAHIPALCLNGLSKRQKRLLVNGASVPFEGCPEGEIQRLYIDGAFMGLAVRDAGGLHITVWLGPENAANGE
ncbi:MAG: tRNA pseudouridine(55) synthase TruB [Clostridia bacterium]|nr:tRNA pseudouridine(55) synthase TruB [Clostridia bacterium]